MYLVNTIASLPLTLLRLRARFRLALIGGSFCLVLGILWLSFPDPLLDFFWVFPLTFACWLFGWKGGLLCLGGIILLVAFHYIAVFGSALWSSIWGQFLLTRIVAALLLCLIVSSLRQLTDALLNARQAYQQAHWLNEAKDLILHSLSHELRTPLTQVQGYLELLAVYHEQLDAATQAQYLAHARSGCDELLALIATALESVPGVRDHRVLQLQSFALCAEVQAVVEHFVPDILREHPLSIDIAEAIQVYAEPRFVRQIVRNLLTNAFKYTPSQTPVRVKAGYFQEHEGAKEGMTPAVRVQIIDAGSGIPPEQQSLLFQQFVRLPNAYLANTPGTGLGLSVCKQLVEAMGGQIWVESSGHAGEGCCFSFTLAGQEKPAEVLNPAFSASLVSEEQKGS